MARSRADHVLGWEDVQEQAHRATPPLGAFTSTIVAEPGRSQLQRR